MKKVKKILVGIQTFIIAMFIKVQSLQATIQAPLYAPIEPEPEPTPKWIELIEKIFNIAFIPLVVIIGIVVYIIKRKSNKITKLVIIGITVCVILIYILIKYGKSILFSIQMQYYLHN